VIIWDLLKHTVVARLPHPSIVRQVRFSADHQFLATEQEQIIRIWDVATGRQVTALAHGDPVGYMLRDGGPKILTRSSYDTFRASQLMVWDYATGARLFSGPDVFSSARVSPDGQTLATTERDGNIRVWDLSNGAILAWIRFAGARDATFSSDGKLLVVTTEDGAQVIAWRSADVLKTACSLLSRNLTAEEWTTYVGNEPYQKTCPNLPGP